MKKFFGILVILSLMLSLCVPALADALQLAGGAIPFRFASREEGLELMLANDEYYAKFSPNKLGYVMQNNDATMEAYFAFAREQVLDWTDEEKDAIARGMKLIEDTFAEKGWTLPPLDTVIFIRTTMVRMWPVPSRP